MLILCIFEGTFLHDVAQVVMEACSVIIPCPQYLHSNLTLFNLFFDFNIYRMILGFTGSTPKISVIGISFSSKYIFFGLSLSLFICEGKRDWGWQVS